MKYQLALPSWDDREIDAIRRIIATGNYSMGDHVARFEREFSAYVGSKHAVMVNSGSSANLLMTAAMFYRSACPLSRCDEVVVPAVSWSTTYFPLHQYGLRLKFVDVDLETLNYDVDQLAAAVSGRTKAIMVPNLLGNPNDFEKIMKIAGDRGIAVLEDNCESMGARFGGRMAGTFGLMGTFSAFFSHHISTMEGGIVVTDDEELYHILLSLRAHGWTRNLPAGNSLCQKGDDPFDEKFRFILPGYNVRPLEMSGAIGLEQLKKLPSFVAERRKNAERFRKAFESDDRFILQREVGESSWFGFSLILKDPSVDRKKVVAALEAAGVDTRPIVAGNFAGKEVVRKYFDYETFGDLANAEYVDKHGFFVGNHHFDISDKIDYLKGVLDNI